MPTFEKKNPIVEAIQWTGENKKEVDVFVLTGDCHTSMYLGAMFVHQPPSEKANTFTVQLNDWIVRDEDHDITVWTPEQFRRHYKEKN